MPCRQPLDLPLGVEGPRRGRVRRAAFGCLTVGIAIVALTTPSWAGTGAPTTGQSQTPVLCKAAPRQLKVFQAQLKQSQTLLGQLRTRLAQVQRRRPAQVALVQSRINQLQQYRDNVVASITDLQQRCGHTAG